MRVDVKLFFHLRRHASDPSGHFSLELPAWASAGQALAALGIPELPAKVLLINGHQARPADKLREGDELVVFPPVEGG